METVMDVLSCFPSNTEVLETFLIEDLLDFGDDADIGGPIEHEHSGNSTLTEESSPSASLDGNSWSSETGASKEQLPESMLCVPPDTLADLEWLSTFEEDSFCLPDFSTPLPPVDYVKAAEEKPENIAERCKFTCNFPVPGRARSKRSRTGGRVWSYGCAFPTPNLNARAYPLESSDSSSSTVGRPSKKHKRKVNGAPAGRKPAPSAAAAADGGANQRKCSHCHVTKTPQWRAGPLGPKTLCNACGVRFKSGRLVPEYRPALSPTFLSEIHSNSHRKILEMRRQKEQQQPLHQQIQHQPRNFQAQNHAQAQNHDDVAALVEQEEDGEKMKMESQGSATEQEDQKTSVH